MYTIRYGNIFHSNKTVKTKLTHPYSYDPIVQYQGPGEATQTIYTDRLLQWDYAKHNRLCELHFGDRGQHWDNRTPQKIEAFLRDWCENQDLKLVTVTEYCNVATGYPTWRLDFFQKEKST